MSKDGPVLEGSLMAETGEPERFFQSLAAEFDTATLLRWSFLLDGATEDQVGPLMGEVRRLRFAEVEPLADEEHAGRYKLWFSEICVHTAATFAARVAVIEQLAERERLVVSDYSAGIVE